MTIFLLDLFPVELVHTIFRYLWAHEILHGFSNQSEYVDSVLQTYDRYAVCLCSMAKNQFDQMCRRIQPKQVFSLAFMDEDETPDQSTLFFSRFDMEKFSNLRSFAIVSPDLSLLQTLNCLCEFRKFKSIVIPQTSDFYWCFSGSYVENILPDLKRLDINSSRLTKPLKNLQYLRIPNCYFHRVEHLLPFVPNLRSLDITISLDTFSTWSNKIPLMNYLRQFILRIYYGQFTMSQIQTVLIQMPHLISFELSVEEPIDVHGGERWRKWSRHSDLDIEVSMDIIDGNQWKYLVSQLHTFDFRFPLLKKPSTSILDSFQSAFWLEEKRWIVAFDDNQSSSCLFTIPRFAPKTILYSMNYHPVASTSNDLCLDQFIRTLNLPIIRPLAHDFPNVTTLTLDIKNDFQRDEILPYLQLPCLYSLAFINLSLLDVLSPNLVFKSIRVLDIKTPVPKTKSEQIAEIFPQIERLQVTIDENDTMLSLIDRLKCLSIAKFINSKPPYTERLTKEWFQEHSSRLKNPDQFTYGMDDRMIQLWMNVE